MSCRRWRSCGAAGRASAAGAAGAAAAAEPAEVLPGSSAQPMAAMRRTAAEDEGYSAEAGGTRELVAGPADLDAMARAPARGRDRRRRTPPAPRSAAAPPGSRTPAEGARPASAWPRAVRPRPGFAPATHRQRRPATLGMRVVGQRSGPARRSPGRASARQAAARVFLCHRSPGEPLRTPEAAAQRGCAPAAPGTARAAAAPRRAAFHQRQSDAADRWRAGAGDLRWRAGRAAAARGARARSEFSVRVRGELTAAQLGEHPRRRARQRPHLAVERSRRPAAREQSLVPAGGARAQRQGRASAVRAPGCPGQPRAAHAPRDRWRCARTLARGQLRELTQEELAALAGTGGAAAAGADWASKRAADAATRRPEQRDIGPVMLSGVAALAVFGRIGLARIACAPRPG